MWVRRFKWDRKPWEAQGKTNGILSEQVLGTGGRFPWLIYKLYRGKGTFYQDIFLPFFSFWVLFTVNFIHAVGWEIWITFPFNSNVT